MEPKLAKLKTELPYILADRSQLFSYIGSTYPRDISLEQKRKFSAIASTVFSGPTLLT